MKRVSTSRQSASDTRRLAALKDADVIIDHDAPRWTPEMFARSVVKRGLTAAPRKTLLSLRVDSDVVEWFRAQGRGYQSRMNALLRAYMDAHRQTCKRPG
ncbi:MAG: BrnA antitoxin family protein [Casimicrobiaceae bacterium]